MKLLRLHLRDYRGIADREIAFRVADLLGDRRHRVKSDIREKDDGGPGLDPRPAVRRERCPVCRFDIMNADEDEE